MSAFTPLGQHGLDSEGEGSFWPSFTDIMMVVVLIFLLATSLLIVRNWNLVAELQASIEAERLAEQVLEVTYLENATLEERLINAEQLNSILRLRILEKQEKLRRSQEMDLMKQKTIDTLETEKDDLQQTIENTRTRLVKAKSTINVITEESDQLSDQISALNQQLDEKKRKLQDQIQLAEATQLELELAMAEIAALSATSEQQTQDIDMLEQEKIEYNRQLLTLKGDYEVVKSKYDQLVKPARSAKGKYVAEVYYVKGEKGKIFRFREPGDADYKDLPLARVEKRLDQLKKEKGKDLYVKIIIPEDSGLSYNEAWGFMRSILVKYDYYYQQADEQKAPE